MWIVKLGGSLAGDRTLRNWLDTLAGCGGGRVVIVPGGGPFADAVRHAQELWGFSDDTAHDMALLAMEQYGLMLAGLCRSLAPARSQDEIYAVLRNAGVVVWLPTTMAGACDEIPMSWDVTADSLSAWLATRMSAERLVLVKSCAMPAPQLEAAELARLGIVDAAFPRWVSKVCFKTFLLTKEQHQTMRLMLMDNRLTE